MLGRAVQLTFPYQSQGEDNIRDTCTASHYLHLGLDHPSHHEIRGALDVEKLRSMNAECASYLLGDFRRLSVTPTPDLKLMNLETAVTASIDNADVPYGKEIRYHLHSENLGRALDGFRQCDRDLSNIPLVVSVANNHVMDYGRLAFERETLPLLAKLQSPSLRFVGCGSSSAKAVVPAVMATANQPETQVQVFAFATGCSGTPSSWWASGSQSGVAGLPALHTHHDVDAAMTIVRRTFRAHEKKKKNALRVVSIHWGPNWALRGEDKAQLAARRDLAHRLIDECGVDMIYGHSSHHVRGMEVYCGKLVLYGAGDLINDYEGFENIGEEHYNRLGGIFVVDLAPDTGKFCQLRVIPFFMNHLRLERLTPSSRIWRPRQHRLDHDPSKIEDWARFINKLSIADAGGPDNALVLHCCDEDSQTPGGPILKTRRFARS